MSMTWFLASVAAAATLPDYKPGTIVYVDGSQVWRVVSGRLLGLGGLENVWVCQPLMSDGSWGPEKKISGHRISGG